MSPETEIRVDLVCTEFLSQFKRLKANAAAVPMTKAETIMRREEALMMRWPLLVVRNERSSDGGDYGLAKHSPGPVFDESANEIQRLRSLLRMVGANLHNPILGGISNDQLSAIDEAIGRDTTKSQSSNWLRCARLRMRTFAFAALR